MKISVLTTITHPKERQDRFKEAFKCYQSFADELIVVDGGASFEENGRIDEISEKMRVLYLDWPDEWNWAELPRHLNEGRKLCAGDWIIKLDIDQMIHERDFEELRRRLSEVPDDCYTATLQKMCFVCGKKYYQKGPQAIAFRNEPDIVFGKDVDNETDLCYTIKQVGTEDVYQHDYKLPIGKVLKPFKTGIRFWNYDYFFKTQEFTKKEFWRFSRAYNRYFTSTRFGDNEERSFEVFLNMQKARYKEAPYIYNLEDHPVFIREEVKNLTPKQFGFNGWELIDQTREPS